MTFWINWRKLSPHDRDWWSAQDPLARLTQLLAAAMGGVLVALAILGR